MTPMNGYRVLGSPAGVRLSGPRPYFNPSAAVLGAPRAFTLGQSGKEWYNRAKAGIAEYEKLEQRARQIANKTERENILAWLGSPTVPTTPAYRFNSVRSDVRENVEAFTPLNYGAYDVERRQNRVVKLEDMNDEFRDLVSTAESVFGKLPPATIIRGEAGDITVPIIAAGAAVVLAVLLSS